jgi:CHAT domain-containing protein
MRSHFRTISTQAATLWLVLICSGCAPQYHMGDALQADPKAHGPQNEKIPATVKSNEWDVKWREIQSASDSVVWTDHFQVCALKYRFRIYSQLFRCLDLLDAKIAAGGKLVPRIDTVRRYSPVMSGWLRATAYAELGEPQVALKWASSAWDALPQPFRSADSMVTDPGMFFSGNPDLKAVFAIYTVGASLGSVGLGGGETSIEEGMFHQGRGNPAALDFRPSMVTMSLAVLRALLYQNLGDIDQANNALADLKRWENLRQLVPGPLGFGHVTSNSVPFRETAEIESIGPLFVRADYRQIIDIYEPLAERIHRTRQSERAEDALFWTLFLPFKAIDALASAPFNHLFPDARLFAVAAEDVANALLYAQSLLRVGRTEDARAMFDTLLAMPEIRAMGNLYWIALFERGRIALNAGQRDQGLHLLVQSVEAIESVRSTILFEAAKIGFLGDKQAVYGALIGSLAQVGDWQQAFVYAERAKARALVDLLAERHDLSPPRSPDARVPELFARASAADTSIGLASVDESVRGIKVVGEAREQLSSVAAEAASLISVQSVDTASIVARLGPDESLIDYYAHGDDLYAFLVNRASIKGFVLVGKGLDEDVSAFRDAINRRNAEALTLGRALYDRLIRPLQADLSDTKLTIAPHGALHYLPFAALSDGENYLLDRYGVRLIPSASTLLYLKSGPQRKPAKLLAIGNPDLGNRALDLPNAQLEANAVAAMFPDSRTLVRAEASKTALKDIGDQFSILHFATHGKFDATAPLNSGLYLAKGSEPSGVLTVGDMYSLRWNADLVTLSGCETGLGRVASGDDVIGLARGFLYAGADSIIASLWEVDDAATAELMESFYRKLGTNDKREALRLAQIETRQKHPKPWYWAAFNIMGRAE